MGCGGEEKRYVPIAPHAPQPGTNLLSSPKHINSDRVCIYNQVTLSDACWYCIAPVWLSTAVSSQVGEVYRVPLNPDIKIQIYIFCHHTFSVELMRELENLQKCQLNSSSCVIMSPFFVTTCFRKYDQ